MAMSGTTSSDRVTCEHHTTANVETNGVGGKVVTSCTETTDATNNLKNVPDRMITDFTYTDPFIARPFAWFFAK